MSERPSPPKDALRWAYWFLEPQDMHEKSPNSGPYMNYGALARFLVAYDMAALEDTDPKRPPRLSAEEHERRNTTHRWWLEDTE